MLSKVGPLCLHNHQIVFDKNMKNFIEDKQNKDQKVADNKEAPNEYKAIQSDQIDPKLSSIGMEDNQ